MRIVCVCVCARLVVFWFYCVTILLTNDHLECGRIWERMDKHGDDWNADALALKWQ